MCCCVFLWRVQYIFMKIKYSTEISSHNKISISIDEFVFARADKTFIYLNRFEMGLVYQVVTLAGSKSRTEITIIQDCNKGEYDFALNKSLILNFLYLRICANLLISCFRLLYTDDKGKP